MDKRLSEDELKLLMVHHARFDNNDVDGDPEEDDEFLGLLVDAIPKLVEEVRASREEDDGDGEEQAFLRGRRAAWVMMLDECLKRLGYDSPETKQVAWVSQREEIVAQLRDVCRDFGDNDWNDGDHLGDVIANNLGKHLHAGGWNG